jgi:hypothetical protein
MSRNSGDVLTEPGSTFTETSHRSFIHLVACCVEADNRQGFISKQLLLRSRRSTVINPLTPELNPSAQRCLTRFFAGDFASWTVHFVNMIYAWKTNKCNNYSFSSLIMYGSPTCFGITLPSSGSVPSAFWEMLKWGAVDTILWMGVLRLVTWSVAIWDVSALHRYPEDGNVIPKHVGLLYIIDKLNE